MTGEVPQFLPPVDPAAAGAARRQFMAQESRMQERLMVEGFRQSLSFDPTFAANVQRLAKDRGLPADNLYELEPQKVRELMAVRDIEQRDLARTNPVLARQLTDPDFARIAHDDIDNLGVSCATRASSPIAVSSFADAFTAGLRAVSVRVRPSSASAPSR